MKNLLSITLEEYMDIVREEALEDAMKEAEEKNRLEKLETARKLKAIGLSATQIGKILGLSSSVIKKL